MLQDLEKEVCIGIVEERSSSQSVVAEVAGSERKQKDSAHGLLKAGYQLGEGLRREHLGRARQRDGHEPEPLLVGRVERRAFNAKSKDRRTSIGRE